MAKFGALNEVKQPSFYCTKNCGDDDFDIDEWNKAFDYCNTSGISEHEADKILNPELFPCTEQCERCINIVLDTQIENKRKREALKKCSR